MPNTLRLADNSYMRRFDVQSIIQFLYTMHSVEIVGYSNIGKSALMRLLAQLDVWTQELGEAGREFLPIYIDCNRMLEMSDQGFYELVLRCLQESSDVLARLPELSTSYESMVAPTNEFQVPLSFNRGLTAALQSTKHRLILLFDEFDEPFTHITSRVFINLRALKDRHGSKLAYVTATEQPLIHRRQEDHCGEFCELFSHHLWQLAPLTRADVERFVHRYMTAFDIYFTNVDIDFIYAWAGGHPRLLNGVCRVLEESLDQAEATPRETQERRKLHQQVELCLTTDEELLVECEKIWSRLAEPERVALLTLQQPRPQQNDTLLASLARQHLLFKVEGKYQPFCRLFLEFLKRKTPMASPTTGHLRVDAERRTVVVGGKPLENLTNLEYRLITLLYENHDKLIDKYEIVTNVWGESYIDEVDDARIEKLVSRVRQKIEVDPSAPKLLTTVRGRGYKLTVE
jgi:DNA-binding winged helix-turn-helix (wHTH) protein